MPNYKLMPYEDLSNRIHSIFKKYNVNPETISQMQTRSTVENSFKQTYETMRTIGLDISGLLLDEITKNIESDLAQAYMKAIHVPSLLTSTRISFENLVKYCYDVLKQKRIRQVRNQEQTKEKIITYS